jgi:hypothetical protein
VNVYWLTVSNIGVILEFSDSVTDKKCNALLDSF